MTDFEPTPEYIENITNTPPLCPACGREMTVDECLASNVCAKCLRGDPVEPA